jgi:hypothetical protein
LLLAFPSRRRLHLIVFYKSCRFDVGFLSLFLHDLMVFSDLLGVPGLLTLWSVP